MGKEDDWGVLPIANPGDYSDDPRIKGLKLETDSAGKGQLAATEQPASIQHASLVGSAPQMSHPANRAGLGGTSAAQAGGYAMPQRTRPPTPDELMAQARDMLDSQTAQHQALLGQGASVGVRDDAGGKIPDWLAKEMEKNGGTDL